MNKLLGASLRQPIAGTALVVLFIISWSGAAARVVNATDEVRALLADSDVVVKGPVVSVRFVEKNVECPGDRRLIVIVRPESVVKGEPPAGDLSLSTCESLFRSRDLHSDPRTRPEPGDSITVFAVRESKYIGWGWEYVPYRTGIYRTSEPLVDILEEVGQKCWDELDRGFVAEKVQKGRTSSNGPPEDRVRITLDTGEEFTISETLLRGFSGDSLPPITRATSSPDGKRVALELQCSPFQYSEDTVIVDAGDRCSPIRLYSGGMMEVGDPSRRVSSRGFARQPVWLNNSVIAYLAAGSTTELYTHDLKTGTQRETALPARAVALVCRLGRLVSKGEDGAETVLPTSCHGVD